ncbi:hypothetical protein D5S17_34225 [Pseudonocardiaceae bacterium YIM PH 21723]|nr:hypothetical protein D5S17_34225 [Pseudonocardiaceae bacterium YIM PH 21723]
MRDRFLPVTLTLTVVGLLATIGDHLALRLSGWLLLVAAGSASLLLLAGNVAQRHWFVVDGSGIHWPGADSQGRELAWGDIAAIGIGHTRQPGVPRRLSDRYALEIYPRTEDFAVRHPELERWRYTEFPPRPELPMTCYRFTLPARTMVFTRLESAIRDFGKRVWIGHYQRSWSPDFSR